MLHFSYKEERKVQLMNTILIFNIAVIITFAAGLAVGYAISKKYE